MNNKLWLYASRWTVFLLITAGLGIPPTQAQKNQANKNVQEYAVTTERILPETNVGTNTLAVQLSTEQREALQQKLLALREAMAASVDNNPRSAVVSVPIPASNVAPTVVNNPPANEFHGTPGSFLIGRNNRNTRANDPALSSTLAEPAAANDGVQVFSAGNFNHAEFSLDGGVTYTNVPVPAGPADAPFACCDNDVIHDQARGITFWSTLYLNGAGTNGVVRLFVRRTIPGATACTYLIDPAGAANNIVPDYPHLGISNNFLYLATNNSNGQMRRLNIDHLADCAAVTINTFTNAGSGRVFVPVEGARDVMYWGAVETPTSFRIFSWPESAAAVSSIVRPISQSNFTNPDCRGGTGNFDFIERSTSFSISGFRLRGAVGANRLSFFWNVGPDAAHTQGHIHAAVFRQSDLTLIAQPHIFNNAFCFGYPIVSANERGDLGITLAYGGKLGGGGAAAQGAVGIDDDFTTGIGAFQLFLTASGTHNRTDSRYGDYFTIHPHEPCDLFFNATNYALSGGTGVANVNSRYIEFGRNRDNQCYLGWRDEVRVP